MSSKSKYCRNRCCCDVTWWHHQMETFSAILALCAGNSPATGKFPTQRPVTRSFDVFLDLSLNKQLSKQSWGWLFKVPWSSLWRNCNDKWILNLITLLLMPWQLSWPVQNCDQIKSSKMKNAFLQDLDYEHLWNESQHVIEIRIWQI